MRLNQITIKVTDLEASIEFYKKLGLRLIAVSYTHLTLPTIYSV